jgi:hypothetical protein
MKSWLLLLWFSILVQLSLNAANPRFIPFTTFQDANHNHYTILQPDSTCLCDRDKHFIEDPNGEIWYFVRKINVDRSVSFGMITQDFLDQLQTDFGMLSPANLQGCYHTQHQS